ncbi:MAG: hypothetical protein EA409_04725 [Saprospirales bacterium]|nr:MAG: hypothetical protein EA409_04725 [Saprospirales bacterium]
MINGLALLYTDFCLAVECLSPSDSTIYIAFSKRDADYWHSFCLLNYWKNKPTIWIVYHTDYISIKSVSMGKGLNLHGYLWTIGPVD